MKENKICAEFMGYTVTPITDLTGYYLTYDHLMPAWVKFRDLKDVPNDHWDYCILIGTAITECSITEAFDELVLGIEWYESIKQ